jgi:hypothetical protein
MPSPEFDLPSSTKRNATDAKLEDPSKKQSSNTGTAETEEQTEATRKDEPKYSQEELSSIFDDIIFTGEYSEEVAIKGRLKVSFRTRTAEEISEISKEVDGLEAKLISTLEQRRSLLNLQYSLCSYQGKDLRGLKVDAKAKFVSSLAGPVIAALLTALTKFDAKVFTACTDGEQNF